MSVVVPRAQPDLDRFNPDAELPYELRLDDFKLAMQDVYDLLYDINSALVGRGLVRFEEMVRPANFSGMLSDALTASVARHSRALTENKFHNGHPDLIPRGHYAKDSVKAGETGVEVKATRGGGSADTHSGRDAWLLVIRYVVDSETEPVVERAPTRFIEVMLAQLSEATDFRFNDRGPRGTRTYSPNAEGMKKLRANWIYRDL